MGKWNAYSVWVGKLELKISHRRPLARLGDNIRTDVK